MANKNMKICSTSLAIREIQIKTKIRYHFIPTRMTIKKKTISSAEDIKKSGPSYIAGRSVKWCRCHGKHLAGSLKS